MNAFTMPWAVVYRATPFHPAIVIERFSHLEDACAAAPIWKRKLHCYTVAVRAV